MYRTDSSAGRVLDSREALLTILLENAQYGGSVLVDQLLEVYPKDDDRLVRMARSAISAKRMSVCCMLACCLALVVQCYNAQTAVRILISVCLVGKVFYAWHGWRYFQSYLTLRHENRVSNELIRKLGLDWGVRFIVPLATTIIVGSLLIAFYFRQT